MDMKRYRESDYVNAQLVQESPSKKLVILDEGSETRGFNEKSKVVEFLVNLDGKKKSWKPNKASLDNLGDAFGDESSAYIGKQVTLTIEKTKNGMEAVVGVPVREN